MSEKKKRKLESIFSGQVVANSHHSKALTFNSPFTSMKSLPVVTFVFNGHQDNGVSHAPNKADDGLLHTADEANCPMSPSLYRLLLRILRIGDLLVVGKAPEEGVICYRRKHTR